MLTKKIPGRGYNLVIHSVAYVNCTFVSGSKVEHYKGETGMGLGIDLQWDDESAITFTVITAMTDADIGTHPLAGKFIGAKASAAVYSGSGLQVLIGGGEKNITLNPIALEGSRGFGAKAGIGYLYLEPAN